jgi:hypothetical protein
MIATRAHVPFGFRLAARWALSDAALPMRPVLDAADRHFADLAPRTARAVTSPGRFNLRMAAYVLALHRGLREQGITDAWASELLSGGLFRVMRLMWRLPDAVVRVRHPRDRVARARMRQRLSRRLLFRDPDWVMTEVRIRRGYGLDITRCVMRDLLAGEGETQLCEDVLCHQDLLMAAARGEHLTRTTTLASGGDRCDFRFS